MTSADDLIIAAKELVQELEKQYNSGLQKDYASELPPVDASTAKKILRKTFFKDAFHFHRDVNKPLWISVNSLSDLYKKIKTVDLRAVEFHFGRGDFAFWIRHLGDTDLADRIRDLQQTNLSGEMLRDALYTLIKSRCDEMQRQIGLLS
jgi:hypothetical protein